jgi:uncharacterized protein
VGQEVTPDRLAQVARAESAVRGLGFRQLRVRHHGEIARIELGKGESGRLTDAGIRSEVIRSVKEAGFRFVVLDLEDYGAARAQATVLYSIDPHRDSGQ